MKIYNVRALTRNQRFAKAVFGGVLAMFACAIILGYGLRFLSFIQFPLVFDFMFLAVGYGVGYGIRMYGHGVQKRFSILGAILTAIALLLADSIYMIGIRGLITPSIWLYVIQIKLYSLSSLSGILSVIFRIGAIIVGYEQSRIV